MNNLEAVAVGDTGFAPLGAGDDFAVMLHRDSVGLEAKGDDHAGEIGRRGELSERAVLSVELNRERCGHT